MKAFRSSPAFRALVFLYLAVFLVMLVLTALTPMLADDYSYCFSWADNRRITSPLQIPASMAVHRQLTNGRVVAHALVQLILLAPKAVFSVLNACLAVFLFLLFARYTRAENDKRRLLLLLLGALLLFNELPAFGQVVLWLDGAVNYGWGMVFFLLFLLPYAEAFLGRERKKSLFRDLAFLLFAPLVGAYSENGSLAMLFAALCLTLLTALREKRLTWQAPAGLLLGVLGYCFLMSAPATRGRSAGLDLSSWAANFKYILNLCRDQLLPLFFLFALCFALCLLLRADRRRMILSAVLFLAGLGSLASFFFASYFVPRHFCFTVFFTVLACLLLFSALLELRRPLLPVLTAAALAVLFAFNFSLGALDVLVIHRHFLLREARIREALAAGETKVALEVYEPATRYSAALGLDDLNMEESRIWPNWSLADYYGLEEVQGLPPAGSAGGKA